MEFSPHQVDGVESQLLQVNWLKPEVYPLHSARQLIDRIQTDMKMLSVLAVMLGIGEGGREGGRVC